MIRILALGLTVFALASCDRVTPAAEDAPRRFVDGAPTHLKSDKTLPTFRSTSDFMVWLSAWQEAKREALKTRGPTYIGHVVHKTQSCFDDRYESHQMPGIPKVGDKAFVVAGKNIFVTDTRSGKSDIHVFHVQLSNTESIIPELNGPRVVENHLLVDGVSHEGRSLHTLQFSFTRKDALVLERATTFTDWRRRGVRDLRVKMYGGQYILYRSTDLENLAFDRDELQLFYKEKSSNRTSGKIYSATSSDGSWPDEPFFYEWRICTDTDDALKCRTTSVLASKASGDPIYDEGAAYLWLDRDVPMVENISDKRPYQRRPRRVLKIPLDGSAPSSVQVLGCPSQVAGVQPDKNGGLVALVTFGSLYDQEDFASLVRIDQADFGGFYSVLPESRAMQMTWPGEIAPFTAYEDDEFLYLGDNESGWYSVQIPSKSKLMQISPSSGALKVGSTRAPSKMVALTSVKFGFLALSETPGGADLSFLARTPGGLKVETKITIKNSVNRDPTLRFAFDPKYPGLVAVQTDRRVSIVKIEQFPVKMRMLGKYDFAKIPMEEMCYGPIRVAFFNSGVMLQDNCRMVRGVVQGGTLEWLQEENLVQPLAQPSLRTPFAGARLNWQKNSPNSVWDL